MTKTDCHRDTGPQYSVKEWFCVFTFTRRFLLSSKSIQRNIHKYKDSQQFHRRTISEAALCINYIKSWNHADLKCAQKIKKKKDKYTLLPQSFLSPTCLNVTRVFCVCHMNSLLLNCGDNSNKVRLDKKNSLLTSETALLTFQTNCKAMTHLLLRLHKPKEHFNVCEKQIKKNNRKGKKYNNWDWREISEVSKHLLLFQRTHI